MAASRQELVDRLLRACMNLRAEEKWAEASAAATRFIVHEAGKAADRVLPPEMAETVKEGFREILPPPPP